MQELSGLFNCSRSPAPQKQCSCIDRGESHMVRIPAAKSTTYHNTLFVRDDKIGPRFKRYLVISTYVASPLSLKYFAVGYFFERVKNYQ